MSSLALPWFVFLLAIPLIATGVLYFLKTDRACRIVGIASSLVSFVGSLLLFELFMKRGHRDFLLDSTRIFGVDELSGPLLPLTCFVTLALILGGPRKILDRRTVQSLLMTQALALGTFAAADFRIFVFFWTAYSIPALLTLRRSEGQRTDGQRPLTRVLSTFLLGGAAPLLLALIWIEWRFGSQGSSHFAYLTNHPGKNGIVFALVTLAALVRVGAVPLHSWMPLMFEKGPYGFGALTASSRLGAYLIARFVVSLAPMSAAKVLSVTGVVGLVTAFYGSLLALAQRDLRRAVGCISMSHGGLILLGLSSLEADGTAGALLLWLTSAIAITGLIIVISAVQARTGEIDMHRLGGLAHKAPGLASAFLLFGVALVAFPGSLGFVAEDLLVHGLLASSPFSVAAFLVVTALNAMTLFRAFSTTFLGPSNRPQPAIDLKIRERTVIAGLIGMLLFAGVFPQTLLSARSHAAFEISDKARGVSHASSRANQDSIASLSTK